MDFLDEDSDDELSSKKPFGGKEATIFVIDCRKSMFNIDSEKSAFILAAIRNLIANTAVSCSSDEIGVILLGTEQTQNSYDFKHIFVLENLKQANVEVVLFFDKTLSKFSEKEFSNKYGINENYSLGELLWLCNGLFNKEKKKYYTKSILLFTNEDNPFEMDKQKRNKSINRAVEVKLNQITIDVIPMRAGFNFGNFYDDIVTTPRFGKTEDYKPEEFMNRILMKSHKQRVFAIIPLNLGPELAISVSVFILVRETKKPFSIKLNRRTNTQLISETQMVTDSAEVVDKSDVLKGISYGETTVYVSIEELKKQRKNEPGLTLLGFKPLECLKPYYHKTPSYFIIPSESKVKGSSCLFNALLQQCHKRRVFAVCKGIFRSTSALSLVALIPQMDPQNLGFHAVILPYSEDIRDINLQAASPVDIPSELIDATKNIVKSLKRDYIPEMVKNPALQKFYSNIEALALQLNEVEPLKDDLKPDVDLIDKVLAKYEHEVESHLPKSKVESGGGSCDAPTDLEEAAKLDQLGKYTVKQLNAFCSSKGIQCPKKKADIIYAINKYYNI